MLRVKHLDLGQGFSRLLGGLLVQQSDERAHRLDPHPRLLEVAFVLLRDPAGGEVDHADDALEQQVLDPDAAKLLLDSGPDLLLAGLPRFPGSSRCLLVSMLFVVHLVDTLSGAYVRASRRRHTIDLLDRGAALQRATSPLRTVQLRQHDIQLQGLASRRRPLGEPLDLGPGRDLADGLEVDHHRVHPVADGAPQVLLDLALAEPAGRSRTALVVVERGLRDAPRSSPEPEGLLAARLHVADPHLHRAEGVMGSHAPPQLRGLDDRIGSNQRVDEIRVRVPAPEAARGSRIAGTCA